MVKNHKKYLVVTIIIGVLIFSWLWTEKFGLFPKYEYGKTIEKALNFWYEHDLSDRGLSKVISIVDIDSNEKLVFYKSTNNTLCCGLVKKKWNNKWIVIQQRGELSFKPYKDKENKEKSLLVWMWSNMREFGMYYGIVFDRSISRIEVGGKKAHILSNNIWYFIDKTGSSYSEHKPTGDVRAYDKNNNLVYSQQKVV